jgi:predicted small metal-binding protein
MKDNIRDFPSTQRSNQGAYSFRCADLGQQCDWEVHGSSQEEVVQQAEEHGREAHNMRNISEPMRYKIRNNIRLAA